MNLGTSSDVDPLSSYDYSQHLPHGYPIIPPVLNIPYPYTTKEQLPNPEYTVKNYSLNYPVTYNAYKPVDNDSINYTPNEPSNIKDISNNIPVMDNKDGIEKEEVKFNPSTDVFVKPRVQCKRKIKREGKKSSYWSEKISDPDYEFYACSVCDVKFSQLAQLDTHVVNHKDRLTSYDLRKKNIIERKRKKREQKKLKKIGNKIKREVLTPDNIEIKPEDGYIGSEKTDEYFNNTNDTNFLNAQSDNLMNMLCNQALPNNVFSKENESNVLNKTTDSTLNSNLNSEVSEGKKKKEKEVATERSINLEKIYKCSACQKQFHLSYYLKLHVRSHTDEKPYVCSTCGESFITASKLGRHNKRIHLAVRYQCRICFVFFTKFDNLTRHFDKKHPEDKLEGEPYDYNAILPYLKELEEELERQKAEKEEQKPKTEDLWPLTNVEAKDDEIVNDDDHRYDDDHQYDDEPAHHLDIVIDDAKADRLEEVEIKEEKPDTDGEILLVTAFEPEVIKDESSKHSFRDESHSDDDYFPSNTWASTPKIEMGPLSPPVVTRRKRRKLDPEQSTGPVKCEICEKVIKTPSYMRVHMRTHTGEKPYKCYVCQRAFITSSKMHRHALTHHAEDEDAVKLEGVKKEMGDEEEEDKKDSEPLKKAKAKLSKKSGPRVKGRRTHSCEYCQKKFLHKETLTAHRRIHAGEPIEIKCKFCLQVMENKELLAEHELTHTGPKPYLCTICGKNYKKKETMIYHRKNHRPDKEYICDVCSKTFVSQSKLQRHIVAHRTEKFILRYECPVCAHMFNTKYHIQMHLTTHQKEGLIREENRSSVLAMVMQNARKIPKHSDQGANVTELIPSDERSRVCNICGEVFPHFYYLEDHLKSHGSKIALENEDETAERKYICQVCNKGFKLHYYLKLHSFTHTKEKPFICQQCGKGFITKGKLKRHIETHTGLKKYQCHICYKFFTRPSYMRIHVRTIHKPEDYNFRVDSRDYGVGIPLNAMALGHG